MPSRDDRRMQTAIILGAGFSKAAANLPLTDELGNELRKRLPRMLSRAAQSFKNGSFETWLSRVAEAQPDLDDVANAENVALFTAATQTLHAILIEREIDALGGDMPKWLHQFVRTLHAARADVITFNYDTLLERAAVSSRCWDMGLNRFTNTESILNGLPPSLPGALADEDVNTFRLMKLHGSLDCYWVRGDPAGSTIVRLPGNRDWGPNTPSDHNHARLTPGREPFIVPPASAKSGFYNNPISRQLWRDAAAALRRADQVAIVGYSLPLTDLVTAGMIGDALGGHDKPIHLVNPESAAIRQRLSTIGIDSRNVHEHSGSDCVAQFSDYLATSVSRRHQATLLASPSTDRLAVLDIPGGLHPVRAVRSIPQGLGLVVDKTRTIVDLSGREVLATAATVRDALTARHDGIGSGLFVIDEDTDTWVPVVDTATDRFNWLQAVPAWPLGGGALGQ